MSNWLPRVVIDAHAHTQRFAAKFRERGETAITYHKVGAAILSTEPYDNAPAVIADMDRHGVDMACAVVAFNMSNDIIAEQVRRYPDRFIGFCGWGRTQQAYVAGGYARFDAEAAAREIGAALSSGLFRGVGEVLTHPLRRGTWEENRKAWEPIMEVVRHYDVPVLFHTGWARYPYPLRLADPIYVDDLACQWPDVKLIIGHAGVQSGWYTAYHEHALMVAAKNDNVYLEISQCSAEQIERMWLDPHIGPDKMIFGSDYGASFTYATAGGRSFGYWPHEPPRRLPEHLAWNLRQLHKVEMPEEDRDKILGLNIARLTGLDVKSYVLRRQEEAARRSRRERS